ncbi:MAG: 4Fe-4S dicluster domain-containing protein [Thermodesulfobacteriota bacterium]
MSDEKKQPAEEEKNGWGIEKIPYPKGVAYISARWDVCVGCGACEMACSMFHYGTVNRELSRIRIYRYLLPLPKSVQNVCSQCPEKERECQKACPEDPPVIHYDPERQHMVVDEDRCLGSGCGQCRDACPAQVPRFYPPEQDVSMVCDLCEKDGRRRPQCVEICPTQALEFISPKIPHHLERIHPDEKAASLANRLYPLPKGRVIRMPEEIWGGK